MQWKLTQEQEAFRDTLRAWLADVAPVEVVRAWLDADDLASFWSRFAEEGWSGVGIPEAAGGQGGGVVELTLTAEELGRASAPGATWLASVLAMPAFAAAARPDLAEAALARGAALLVPGDQLPSAAPALALGPAGRVTGRVPLVLAGADVATYVAVTTAHGKRQLRVIDASAAGIATTPRRPLDRSRSIADVELNDVESEPLDGSVDEVLERITDLAGVLVAADSLGATERMLELTVDYSKQRHQFGVPIGSFQAVKHAAATIEVAVEAGRSAIYYAAASVGARHEERSLHAAAVKAQMGVAGFGAADSALTLHGAIGYTWEHDLQLSYKRARLDTYLFAGVESWNERLAHGLALM